MKAFGPPSTDHPYSQEVPQASTSGQVPENSTHENGFRKADLYFVQEHGAHSYYTIGDDVFARVLLTNIHVIFFYYEIIRFCVNVTLNSPWRKVLNYFRTFRVTTICWTRKRGSLCSFPTGRKTKVRRFHNRRCFHYILDVD